MRIDNRKSGINDVKIVFYVLVLVAAVLVFGTIRSTSFNRMSGTKLLHQIRADTLAYRLAELESALSSDETQRDAYKDRMISAQQRLGHNLKSLEPVLVTDEEKRAYGGFHADWKAFINNSSTTPELLSGNIDRQAETAYAQTSRALYEKSRQSLETLLEAKANAPESWSGFFKVFTAENRLTLAFLYICGTTAFFILVFNLYDKVRRRKNNAKC